MEHQRQPQQQQQRAPPQNHQHHHYEHLWDLVDEDLDLLDIYFDDILICLWLHTIMVMMWRMCKPLLIGAIL